MDIFHVSLQVSPTVSQPLIDYLNRFSSSRRVKRDSSKIADLNYGKGLDYCFKKVGEEGAFYAYAPQPHITPSDDSIVDINVPPTGQPSLWCDFKISDAGTQIICTNCEQADPRWIEYLIETFLKPEGYVVNGEVEYENHESGSLHRMIVNNNVVTTVSDFYKSEVTQKVAYDILRTTFLAGDYDELPEWISDDVITDICKIITKAKLTNICEE